MNQQILDARATSLLNIVGPSAMGSPNFSSSANSTSGLPLNMLVDAVMGTASGGVLNHPFGGATIGNISYEALIEKLRNNAIGIGGNETGGMKRAFLEECRRQGISNTVVSNPNKKLRTSLEHHSISSTTMDNSALMERLCAMSGGFPMPRWGYMSASSIAEEAVKTSHALEVETIPNRRGSFPMPRVKEEDPLPLIEERPVLKMFEQVWQNAEGDLEMQKEALFRMMHKGRK
jgi:hypothetical protein